MRGTVNTFYRGSNPLNAYPFNLCKVFRFLLFAFRILLPIPLLPLALPSDSGARGIKQPREEALGSQVVFNTKSTVSFVFSLRAKRGKINFV
jgi:hypothetical protein